VRGAAAVFLLVLLAGCGGGDSRESFVDDATDICRRSNARVTALGTPESFTDTLLYARQAEDAVGDELDELSELSPPDELQAPFGEYLATLQDRRRQLELLADAADRNHMADIQGIGSELNALSTRAKSQSRRAGVPVCE
jgi:hypothetical protein